MKASKYNHRSTEPIYKIYYIEEGVHKFYGYITYGDINKATHKYARADYDTFQIELLNRDIFYNIAQLKSQYDVLLEYLLYKEGEIGDSTGLTSKYNPIHFVAQHKVSKGYDDNGRYTEQYLIGAACWEGYKEARTIVEHNVEYTYSEIPVDDSGEQNYPYNFNHLQYPANDLYGNECRYLGEILQDLYLRNMGVAVNTTTTLPVPYHRIKGSPHSEYDPTPARTPQSYGGLIINGELTSPTYYITYVKKSIAEFKYDYYNWLESNGIYDTFRTHYKIIDGLGVIVQNKSGELVIDARTDKDLPVKYSIEYNDFTHINNVLIESQNDDFYETQRTRMLPQHSMRFEAIDQAAGDQEDSQEMITNADKVLGENAVKVDVVLDLDFVEKKYLKDFTTGDIVTLRYMKEELLNGKYVIEEIEEVIAEGTIDYAITSFKKID